MPSRRYILMVSVDPLLRERIYDTLTRNGYTVQTACSGEIAVESLKHARPDLILANSGADDCGGWGLADRVRIFDHQLPIIVLGHPEAVPDTRTVRDIQAVLPADATEEELLSALHRWLPDIKPAETLNYPDPILVVDDEADLVRQLQEFLERRGCTILTATSGEEAIAQLERGNPGLVLLDIKMPGMDGLVTLRKLKARRPNLRVVIASAVEDQDLMAQAFVLGAQEYLAKPYNLRAMEELLRFLKKLSAA